MDNGAVFQPNDYFRAIKPSPDGHWRNGDIFRAITVKNEQQVDNCNTFYAFLIDPNTGKRKARSAYEVGYDYVEPTTFKLHEVLGGAIKKQIADIEESERQLKKKKDALRQMVDQFNEELPEKIAAQALAVLENQG